MVAPSRVPPRSSNWLQQELHAMHFMSLVRIGKSNNVRTACQENFSAAVFILSFGAAVFSESRVSRDHCEPLETRDGAHPFSKHEDCFGLPLRDDPAVSRVRRARLLTFT